MALKTARKPSNGPATDELSRSGFFLLSPDELRSFRVCVWRLGCTTPRKASSSSCPFCTRPPALLFNFSCCKWTQTKPARYSASVPFGVRMCVPGTCFLKVLSACLYCTTQHLKKICLHHECEGSGPTLRWVPCQIEAGCVMYKIQQQLLRWVPLQS